MAKKLIDTDIKLGKGTLLLEALEDLGIDFPIEWGESSNGRWEKWKSGKLVQWGEIEKVMNINNKYGSLYRTETNSRHTFPIAFKDTPDAYIQSTYNTSFGAYFNDVSPLTFGWRPVHVFPQNINVKISWRAVGRWK